MTNELHTSSAMDESAMHTAAANLLQWAKKMHSLGCGLPTGEPGCMRS